MSYEVINDVMWFDDLDDLTNYLNDNLSFLDTEEEIEEMVINFKNNDRNNHLNFKYSSWEEREYDPKKYVPKNLNIDSFGIIWFENDSDDTLVVEYEVKDGVYKVNYSSLTSYSEDRFIYSYYEDKRFREKLEENIDIGWRGTTREFENLLFNLFNVEKVEEERNNNKDRKLSEEYDKNFRVSYDFMLGGIRVWQKFSLLLLKVSDDFYECEVEFIGCNFPYGEDE